VRPRFIPNDPMLKPEDNPPVRSPGVPTIAELQGRWWVAHTKARFEKAFAWELLHRRIGYFLPLVEQSRFSGGRRRRLLVPLFPSYVFFCGSLSDRHAALATGRICQTIEAKDQAGLIDELLRVEKVIEGRAKIDLYPFAAVGRRCRIRGGPFEGIEGVVVERNDRTARIVLQVSVLGRGAAMEVDADLLEEGDGPTSEAGRGDGMVVKGLEV
jgi:hypothetical protein